MTGAGDPSAPERRLPVARFPVVRFVAIVAATMLAEGMITVTLLWESVRAGQSPLVVGAILFVMNVVPFALQAVVRPLRAAIEDRPVAMIAATRLIGVPVAGLGVVLAGELSLATLALLAAGLAFVTFLSQQCIETLMGQLTVARVLEAGRSARLSQTALQMGVFAGNALAGVLLATAGTRVVFAVIAAALAIGIVLPLVMRGVAGADADAAPRAAAGPAPAGGGTAAGAAPPALAGWLLVGCMALLAVQLSGYNFFVPLLFEAMAGMTAADYGAVSAAAGVGALAATFVRLPARRATVPAVCLLVMLGDVVIAVSGLLAVSLAASFAIGFGFNSTRILVRQRIFEGLRSRADSALWGGRVTVGFRATNAAVPLVFGLSLAGLGEDRAALCLAAIGVGVMGIAVPALLAAGGRAARASGGGVPAAAAARRS